MVAAYVIELCIGHIDLNCNKCSTDRASSCASYFCIILIDRFTLSFVASTADFYSYFKFPQHK